MARMFGTWDFRKIERSDRRRSAAEELRLGRTKQTRASCGCDEPFGQERCYQQESRSRAGGGMNVERTDRAGHLAQRGMRAVRDTFDKEIGVDVGGCDELSQQHQRGDWRR